LHNTGVLEEIADVRAAGCVMVTVAVDWQLFTSLIVAVYVPAARPVAVALVWPDGVHR
jgi:hypothetical protein